MEITTKTKLEEIAIKIDAHGKAAIENILTVGKLLCDAREMLPANNEFGEWREKRLPWLNTRLSQLWMNAYKNNGECLSRNNFATTVIYQLTAPEVPESARQEALEHDALTVKQSKEIAQAHKEIESLKAKCSELESCEAIKEIEPSLDNLIPGVKEVYDRQGIMRARALKISTMPAEGQQQWLSIYCDNLSLENQLNEKTAKLADLESRPEPEPIKIPVEKMPEGAEEKILEAENKLKEAQKKDRQATKIFKSFDQLKAEKAELEATAMELNRERNELARKIKAFEESTTTATPASIDDARFIKLSRINKELDWIFPDILKEADLAGGYMPKSKDEILEIISKWTSLMREIDGRSVIDI